MLEDGFGRETTGVRISLTDRCNFDCVYCHNEGLGDTRGPMEPADAEMSTDDVVRFLEVADEFDIEKAKFTGGEPLLREDLEEIVRRTPDGIDTSVTTNGTFLPERAEGLVEAGLERVNVSQDALSPEAFQEVTKSTAYDEVMAGIDAALGAGLDPVKLNMVVFEHTAGYVPEMVDHVAENEGLQLQLIEYMPELAGRPEWAVDIDRVHGWLEEQADRVERREMHGRRRYFVGEDDPDLPGGMVEIVDPVGNADFCANCHRVRVTHEGYLKGCLNRNDDLKSMGEMTKPEIRETFRETVDERVPYYGEYMIKDDDGEWVFNEKYLETEHLEA
ncbi:probable cyclic pyranopterin monophosphate synthase [Natronomonas moolapensis 8.8.11]|uniref:Probable GTP 3',8-cyclase n=1 Tax=Natronomonas moolapensis (strain DSM 18674 / CECT 7526 / JCM 14361 / 8.8.11) TaxID=268739 RepID=M1XRW0_NATM8|nr:GTP 3',8-cyclase MoaA [Natronomonas moolapensis]CCQ36992.1 probable cyclic pyranopterin monophosphate synthase [Natronomonas moolapensis 8.8.11]